MKKKQDSWQSECQKSHIVKKGVWGILQDFIFIYSEKRSQIFISIQL